MTVQLAKKIFSQDICTAAKIGPGGKGKIPKIPEIPRVVCATGWRNANLIFNRLLPT